MRFMVLVKGDERSEEGQMPSSEELAEMGKYNEELANAGVMLAGEGLHPSSKDARVAALEQWPESGVPDNPGAWLMATAKHRAIDLLRRRETLERKREELARELELQRDRGGPDIDAALDDY